MERNDIYTPGITAHKIMHMLAVARKCYTLAREKYELSETTARKCFVMGLLHDIGYEFSDSASTHPEVGADMLNSLNVSQFCAIVDAVRNHGKIYEMENVTKWDYILNEADLTVDSKGNNVSIEERLDDIKGRYGKSSTQYKDALSVTKMLVELEERMIEDNDC